METKPQSIRFTRQAIVLRQPLLVFLSIAFVLALLVARFGPWGGGEPPAPVEPSDAPSVWFWLFWGVVLAIVALGVWMLCHGEEIVFDAVQQRVTQTHRFLHRDLKTNQWRFADFTGIAVVLNYDKEHRGSAMPTGGATLTTARTVYIPRYRLSLGRPDLVLKTAERTLTAPAHPLDLPLPDDRDPHAAEAAARTLARLGGWPARRSNYTWQADSAGESTTVRPLAGADEPLPPA